MRWIFVDRILELRKGRYARALKNVSMGEDYLSDHLPSFPVMPPSLIIEALAQTGGALAACTRDFRDVTVLAKIDKATFRGMVRPGDQMTLEVELVENRSEGCRIRGTAAVDGAPVADAAMLFARVDMSPAYPDPPDRFVFAKPYLSLLHVERFAEGATDSGLASAP